MSKKTIRQNFRVVVEPQSLDNFGFTLICPDDDERERLYERLYMRRCQDIAQAIKRHVDCVEYINVEWDVEIVCSHCGEEWEDDPVCCNEAVDEREGQS